MDKVLCLLHRKLPIAIGLGQPALETAHLHYPHSHHIAHLLELCCPQDVLLVLGCPCHEVIWISGEAARRGGMCFVGCPPEVTTPFFLSQC